MVGQVHSALKIIVSLYLCTHVELHFVVLWCFGLANQFPFSDREKGGQDKERGRGRGRRGREGAGRDNQIKDTKGDIVCLVSKFVYMSHVHICVRY